MKLNYLVMEVEEPGCHSTEVKWDNKSIYDRCRSRIFVLPELQKKFQICQFVVLSKMCAGVRCSSTGICGIVVMHICGTKTLTAIAHSDPS